MDRVDPTPETFTPLSKFGHPIQRGVMPLLTKRDASEEPIGTGFMISPDGLMMTAAHVVEAAFSAGQRRLSPEGKFYDHCELYALYLTDEEHGDKGELLGSLLPINKTWMDPAIDIAFCWVSRPTLETGPLPFKLSALSPGLPNVGEKVLGLGYYQMKSHRPPTGAGGKKTVNYSQQTALTPGEIIRVYPERRDEGMIRWPCFETDARFDAGMSGGPIWNEHGSVCGVICSSSSYTSFASLIWPALGIYIEAITEVGGAIEKITIFDLIRKGKILADDSMSDVSLTWGSSGERTICLKPSP